MAEQVPAPPTISPAPSQGNAKVPVEVSIEIEGAAPRIGFLVALGADAQTRVENKGFESFYSILKTSCRTQSMTSLCFRCFCYNWITITT